MVAEIPVHDGLMTRDEQGRVRLIGGECPACRRRHFPQAAHCPWCGHEAVSQVLLDRSGTLWGWTSVASAPPGYEGEVPFGFGVVELPTDGLRVITRLTVADPAALAFGQPMSLVTLPVAGEGADRSVVWAFAPGGDPDA